MQVLYIYSGKGGVGKSSVCVNLAYTLKHMGLQVGVFDADFSGPSIPNMVRGLEDQPQRMHGQVIEPGVFAGVKIGSLGFTASEQESLYWSGKYLEGAIHQFLLGVTWDVDVLLVDLPPGTHDMHQLIYTQVPGRTLVVTLPHEASYQDLSRSLDFMERLKQPVLGVVENMSYYQCSCCGNQEYLFQGDTQASICLPHRLPLLAQLPFDLELNRSFSAGHPISSERLLEPYHLLAHAVLPDLCLAGPVP